jgi:MoaA/NifB/PqqE/SkfB family radical SAM enzyme
VKKIKAAGVARLSLSLDGPTVHEHDSFRGVTWSFESIFQGAAILKEEDLPVQINSTITLDNIL